MTNEQIALFEAFSIIMRVYNEKGKVNVDYIRPISDMRKVQRAQRELSKAKFISSHTYGSTSGSRYDNRSTTNIIYPTPLGVQRYELRLNEAR